jgi:molybdenum cofactor cytidylyltransferase
VKFGEIPLALAEGAILAHSQRLGRRTFKKGRVLSSKDVADLAAGGITNVIAARTEAGDIGEDEAAGIIANAMTGTHAIASAPFTGRVNLHTEIQGLVVVDRSRLDEINQVDEAITIAVVSPFELVEARQTIATIKIIPFAISGTICNDAADIARGLAGVDPLIRVVPLVQQNVGLIQTRLSGTKESVLDKTATVTASRLEILGSRISTEIRCDHCADNVADAIVEMHNQDMDIILISGASAITDRRDIVPAAIVDAGGIIDHFGMPVDPGNLLLVARLGITPIVGLPGCARSPKFNGFDWVLRRLAARLPVTSAEITTMGAGGLLTDIPTRPLPRSKIDKATTPSKTSPIAAVVLAAGQSRRMGQVNKLLAEIDGQAMVTRAVDAARASGVSSVYVVIGHEGDEIRKALAGRQVTFIDNPDYDAGLSSSLKCGIKALPDSVDGAVICLGDMPRVTATEINRLIDTFDPSQGRAICLPTYDGQRGNPVLWARSFFAEMQEITGDVGARHLLKVHGDMVVEVEMAEESVLLDIDTPQALADAKS